jgi:hypothetical protein
LAGTLLSSLIGFRNIEELASHQPGRELHETLVAEHPFVSFRSFRGSCHHDL